MRHNKNSNLISSDTLGQLIDKLIIANLKMWFNQEKFYEVRRLNQKEFEEKYANNMGELHKILETCADLNIQRNELIECIDERVKSIFDGKIRNITKKSHKTY